MNKRRIVVVTAGILLLAAGGTAAYVTLKTDPPKPKQNQSANTKANSLTSADKPTVSPNIPATLLQNVSVSPNAAIVHYAYKYPVASNGTSLTNSTPTKAMIQSIMADLNKQQCKASGGCSYVLWNNAASYQKAASGFDNNVMDAASKYGTSIFGIIDTGKNYTYYSAQNKTPELDVNMMPVDN